MPDDCSYCGLPLRNPYLTDNAQEAAEEIAALKAVIRDLMVHRVPPRFYDTDGAYWCYWCDNWVASPDGHAPDCLGERARGLIREGQDA